jgi:hypothetical protein
MIVEQILFFRERKIQSTCYNALGFARDGAKKSRPMGRTALGPIHPTGSHDALQKVFDVILQV